MTLDEKKEALNFLYMLVECYEVDQTDEEDKTRHALAQALVDGLEKQTYEAIYHRDLTRKVMAERPDVSLASARKAVTRAIKNAKKENN
jgi:hypothetical protein